MHFGSLLAALVSYCQAKANDGLWMLRIEDVDETRAVPGADRLIIQTLADFGMHSDEPVMYQTSAVRQQAYQAALKRLNNSNLTFPCYCTRKQLSGHEIYPGTCRNTSFSLNKAHSIRLKTDHRTYTFNDRIQGPQAQQIAQQSGDFNIKRKDGLFCYQLAVVVDDAAQAITEVVRGIDIMDSTSRQMYLIELLNLPQPKYVHFPVVIDAQQQKLSKQNHAKAITHEDPYQTTLHALHLLKQEPPLLKQKTQSKLLDWAVANWSPERLQGMTQISL